jgi:hypothetical protein
VCKIFVRKSSANNVGEIDTLSAEVKMQLGPNLVPACISVADTSQMSFLGVGRAGHTEAVKANKDSPNVL